MPVNSAEIMALPSRKRRPVYIVEVPEASPCTSITTRVAVRDDEETRKPGTRKLGLGTRSVGKRTERSIHDGR